MGDIVNLGFKDTIIESRTLATLQQWVVKDWWNNLEWLSRDQRPHASTAQLSLPKAQIMAD